MDALGPGPGPLAHDRNRRAELRDATASGAALLALLLLIDLAAGHLTPVRAALWAALSVLLFLLLAPPRVTAGHGWLAVRGLFRERRVRTDALVSVRCLDGVARRIVLRDAHGGRVELAPGVLVANPDLWRLVADGARTSLERGVLLCGGTELRRLARQVDGETARLVFRVSALEEPPRTG